MKKGFTLVELLAVLVILAVILLIAIPIVQKTIYDSKISANKSSIDLYGRAADQAIETYQLTNHTDPTTFSDIEGLIEYNGKRVVCSTKQINDDMTVYLADCKVGEEVVEDYTYGKEPEPIFYLYQWCLEEMGGIVDGPRVGNAINLDDYTEENGFLYSTTAPNGKTYYNKLKIENNVVTEGYSCAILEGTEWCVRGGDKDRNKFYEDNNLVKLREIAKDNEENELYICGFNDGSSGCEYHSGGLYVGLLAERSGNSESYNSYGRCDVDGEGYSYCEY